MILFLSFSLWPKQVLKNCLHTRRNFSLFIWTCGHFSKLQKSWTQIFLPPSIIVIRRIEGELSGSPYIIAWSILRQTNCRFLAWYDKIFFNQPPMIFIDHQKSEHNLLSYQRLYFAWNDSHGLYDSRKWTSVSVAFSSIHKSHPTNGVKYNFDRLPIIWT